MRREGEPYFGAEKIGNADRERPEHGKNGGISRTLAHWTLVQ
jgi:hypothetical protein